MKFVKDPDARLDYTWDWTPWLAEEDKIVSAQVTKSEGVEVGDIVFTGATVMVWLSGGTARSAGRVTVQVTTAQGRVDERTLVLQIQHR